MKCLFDKFRPHAVVWMETKPGVYVAWLEGEIAGFLDRSQELQPGPPLESLAAGSLVNRLKDYISSVAR